MMKNECETGSPTAFIASIGKRLVQYQIAADSGSVERKEMWAAPEAVQYACFDPNAHILYMVCSDGGPGLRGSRHLLIALKIDLDGARKVGPAVPLAGRPIHVCHDMNRRLLLVSYEDTVKLSIHALADDGAVGSALAEGAPAECYYPHQVVVAPHDAGYVLVCRGSDAKNGKTEQPGGLYPFKFDGHKIQYGTKIAPDGGYGFGPRNIVFDKAGNFAYVVLERQNLFLSYAVKSGHLSPAPVASLPTTHAPRAYLPQIAGAVRVHPNGGFAYVANRTHRTRGDDVLPDMGPGANTISVYSIDSQSGKPTLVHEQATGGIHPRTISMSDDGRLLIAAHVRKATFKRHDAYREVPASLAIFRVCEQGHIAPMLLEPVDIGQDLLFWSSFVGWNREQGCSHND